MTGGIVASGGDRLQSRPCGNWAVACQPSFNLALTPGNLRSAQSGCASSENSGRGLADRACLAPHTDAAYPSGCVGVEAKVDGAAAALRPGFRPQGEAFIERKLREPGGKAKDLRRVEGHGGHQDWPESAPSEPITSLRRSAMISTRASLLAFTKG